MISVQPFLLFDVIFLWFPDVTPFIHLSPLVSFVPCQHFFIHFRHLEHFLMCPIYLATFFLFILPNPCFPTINCAVTMSASQQDFSLHHILDDCSDDDKSSGNVLSNTLCITNNHPINNPKLSLRSVLLSQDPHILSYPVASCDDLPKNNNPPPTDSSIDSLQSAAQARSKDC